MGASQTFPTNKVNVWTFYLLNFSFLCLAGSDLNLGCVLKYYVAECDFLLWMLNFICISDLNRVEWLIFQVGRNPTMRPRFSFSRMMRPRFRTEKDKHKQSGEG
jgi:hypothetical protein